MLGAQSSNNKQTVGASSVANNLLNDSMNTKWKFYKQLESAVD